MTEGPAMTRDEALAAIATGRRVVADLRADATGLDLLGHRRDGDRQHDGRQRAVGGLHRRIGRRRDRPRHGHRRGRPPTRKIAVIETALARHRPDPADPIGVLAASRRARDRGPRRGHRRGGRSHGIPVVLDGFISGSAALVAVALEPRLGPRLIAGHRSSEPGHRIVLDHLGLTPILDLDLRLGEASGAALAMAVIVAAVAIRDEMATFDSAGVAGPS